MTKYDKYAASIMAYNNLTSGQQKADHRLYIFKVVKDTDATGVFNAILHRAQTDFFPETAGYYGWDIILTRIEP